MALKDVELAKKVATHKSFFFKEKDKNSQVIDYAKAVSGQMCMVPSGDALKALEADYKTMQESGITAADAPDFGVIIDSCREMEVAINSNFKAMDS
ncbi:hypothetical protein D9M70_440240 [compost metagenome]